MPSSSVHPAALAPEALLRQCTVSRARRSGPGGQRRNKVETAVVLRHEPSGIEAEASERRSQSENQSTALRRLRIKLALEIRQDVSPRSAPSRLWQSRCRNQRLAVNPRHEDYPAILAEALDVLFREGLEMKKASGRLGCTGSQLTKLMKAEPRALAMINARRKEIGLGPLK